MTNLEETDGQFGRAFREIDRRASDQQSMNVFGKIGAHPHDRMSERTEFHPSHVDMIQRAVDTLGLPKGSYHLPLRKQDGSVAGYAQFKGVPNRKAPVLATILGPAMRPGGRDIEAMLKLGRFVERDEMKAPVGPLARPGRQETPSYAIDRAFTNATQPTGDAVEAGT